MTLGADTNQIITKFGSKSHPDFSKGYDVGAKYLNYFLVMWLEWNHYLVRKSGEDRRLWLKKKSGKGHT